MRAWYIVSRCENLQFGVRKTARSWGNKYGGASVHGLALIKCRLVCKSPPPVSHPSLATSALSTICIFKLKFVTFIDMCEIIVLKTSHTPLSIIKTHIVDH